MSKRRSRQDKIRAKKRRILNKPKLDVKKSRLLLQQTDNQVVDLLHYDVALIKKDLLRTMFSTAVILLVLIALYFKL